MYTIGGIFSVEKVAFGWKVMFHIKKQISTMVLKNQLFYVYVELYAQDQ